MSSIWENIRNLEDRRVLKNSNTKKVEQVPEMVQTNPNNRNSNLHKLYTIVKQKQKTKTKASKDMSGPSPIWSGLVQTLRTVWGLKQTVDLYWMRMSKARNNEMHSASGLVRHGLLSLKTTVVIEVHLGSLSTSRSVLITHWLLKRNGAQIVGGGWLPPVCWFSLLLLQRTLMQFCTYRQGGDTWVRPAAQASFLPHPLSCLSILFRLGSISYILPEVDGDNIYTTNSHIRNWYNLSSKAQQPPADSALTQRELTITKWRQNSQCTCSKSWASLSLQRIRETRARFENL